MSDSSKFAFWAVAALLLAAGPLGGQQPAKRVPQKSKGDVVIARLKRARASTTLLPGLNARGELDRSDPTLASDKTPYDVWRYAGRAGEVLTVMMRSTRADAYLMVMREGDSAIERIAEDDDGLGAGTTDAGLRIQLPADGDYLIVANAAATLGPQFFYGPYNLEVVSSLSVSAATNWATLYPGGGAAGDKYAVVVGISDYPGEGEDLSGPRQDAEIFREVLINRFGFKEQNIITLTDRNGNRDQIINAFRRFLSQAGPNGTAVFYYSGDGTQLDENVGLTGADDPEEDGKDEALYVWGNTSEGKGSLILDDELGILAGELNAGRVLIVLDACYSGTGTRGNAGGSPKLARFEDIKSLLDRPKAFLGTKGMKSDLPAGHILLSASGNKEVSWTASGWPTRGGLASVFTYYLVEAMYKALPGTTVEQLMATVAGQTNDFTKASYGKTQTPQAEGTRVAEALAAYLGQ